MPKVFVTQEVRSVNYATAADFGEVIFLALEEYKPEPTTGDINTRIKVDMVNKFADYVAGRDYILTGGSPISILITGMLMGMAFGKNHKVLKWNNQSMRYDLCVI